MNPRQFEALLDELMAGCSEGTIEMDAFHGRRLDSQEVIRQLGALKRTGRITGFVLIQAPSGAQAFFILRSMEAAC
jgi:hypothetical protein